MKTIMAGVLLVLTGFLGTAPLVKAVTEDELLTIRGMVYVTSEGEEGKNVVLRGLGGERIPITMDTEGQKLQSMNKSMVELDGFEEGDSFTVTRIRPLPTPSTIPPLNK
jgi:hypothetical protein